jgi:hypothetical protein
MQFGLRIERAEWVIEQHDVGIESKVRRSAACWRSANAWNRSVGVVIVMLTWWRCSFVVDGMARCLSQRVLANAVFILAAPHGGLHQRKWTQ